MYCVLAIFADAAMLAASSLPPTTTIPAISAHRGAHTMKMITNYIGFSRRRAQTHQGLGEALQTSSLRAVRAECPCTQRRVWRWCTADKRPRPTSRHGTAASLNHTSPLFPKNEQYVDLTFHLATQLARRVVRKNRLAASATRPLTLHLPSRYLVLVFFIFI